MSGIKIASLAIAIGLAGLAASANADAASFVTDCTGCSMAQIESLAPKCAGVRAAGGRYISDFDSGNLYYVCYTIAGTKINATGVGISPNSQTRIIYHWNQPNAVVQNQFQAYYNVYQNNGHIKAESASVKIHTDLRPKISLGDDGYMNAYDTVNATANNDAVLEFLDSTNFTTANVSNFPGKALYTPALYAAVVSLLNSVKTGIVSFDFKVVVEVVFNDGSSRDYTIDQAGNWQVIPNTARDAHGNAIPENYSDIANGGRQTYSFEGSGPGYDKSNFTTTLTLYGVPVTNGGGGGGGGGVIACTTVGGDTHCTYIKLN